MKFQYDNEKIENYFVRSDYAKDIQRKKTKEKTLSTTIQSKDSMEKSKKKLYEAKMKRNAKPQTPKNTKNSESGPSLKKSQTNPDQAHLQIQAEFKNPQKKNFLEIHPRIWPKTTKKVRQLPLSDSSMISNEKFKEAMMIQLKRHKKSESKRPSLEQNSDSILVGAPWRNVKPMKNNFPEQNSDSVITDLPCKVQKSGQQFSIKKNYGQFKKCDGREQNSDSMVLDIKKEMQRAKNLKAPKKSQKRMLKGILEDKSNRSSNKKSGSKIMSRKLSQPPEEQKYIFGSNNPENPVDMGKKKFVVCEKSELRASQQKFETKKKMIFDLTRSNTGKFKNQARLKNQRQQLFTFGNKLLQPSLRLKQKKALTRPTSPMKRDLGKKNFLKFLMNKEEKKKFLDNLNFKKMPSGNNHLATFTRKKNRKSAHVSNNLLRKKRPQSRGVKKR